MIPAGGARRGRPGRDPDRAWLGRGAGPGGGSASGPGACPGGGRGRAPEGARGARWSLPHPTAGHPTPRPQRAAAPVVRRGQIRRKSGPTVRPGDRGQGGADSTQTLWVGAHGGPRAGRSGIWLGPPSSRRFAGSEKGPGARGAGAGGEAAGCSTPAGGTRRRTRSQLFRGWGGSFRRGGRRSNADHPNRRRRSWIGAGPGGGGTGSCSKKLFRGRAGRGLIGRESGGGRQAGGEPWARLPKPDSHHGGGRGGRGGFGNRCGGGRGPPGPRGGMGKGLLSGRGRLPQGRARRAGFCPSVQKLVGGGRGTKGSPNREFRPHMAGPMRGKGKHLDAGTAGKGEGLQGGGGGLPRSSCSKPWEGTCRSRPPGPTGIYAGGNNVGSTRAKPRGTGSKKNTNGAWAAGHTPSLPGPRRGDPPRARDTPGTTRLSDGSSRGFSAAHVGNLAARRGLPRAARGGQAGGGASPGAFCSEKLGPAPEPSRFHFRHGGWFANPGAGGGMARSNLGTPLESAEFRPGRVRRGGDFFGGGGLPLNPRCQAARGGKHPRFVRGGGGGPGGPAFRA